MLIRINQRLLIAQSFKLLLIFSAATQLANAMPQNKVAAESGTADSQTPLVSVIKIEAEPQTIDPAKLIAPRLAMPTTVEFEAVSLKDVYNWLQQDQKLSISVDHAAMRADGILSSELITERLEDEPLYLLLDRLKSLGIGWYEEGGDLFLTTTKLADAKMIKASYNLGELLDAGFDSDLIVEAITSCAGGLSIDLGDEDGSVVLLGDVAFARQTQHVQREIRGLLTGLKAPARRTLTLDPPQHKRLRDKLLDKFSIALEEVPLIDAINQLAKISGADIRLHIAEVKLASVRDRSPVTVEMADQKLGLILQAVLSELKLTYLIQDGVIWVVRDTTAKSVCHTAVYDVRDLCRNFDESEALKYALMEQVGGQWKEDGSDIGNLGFPRPGTMIVRHTEQMLDSVLQLLENYRSALRESKPRKKTGADPNEILTYYYRMSTDMAQELQGLLPSMVRRDTWKSESNPDAIGTIRTIKSTSDLKNSGGQTVVYSSAKTPGSGLMIVENSVLVIRQKREVHFEIDDLVNKITRGERPRRPNYGGGGGLGGGGGFGGGFFNLKIETSNLQ